MKNDINFLPIQQRKKKNGYFSKSKIWSGVVLGSCLILVIIYGCLSVMDRICINKINQAEEVIKNKNTTQIATANLNEQNNLLAYRYKLTESITENKDILLKSLTGIHDVLPAGVILLEYTYENGLLNISGETKNQEDILQFREKLAAQALFKTVNIINTNKKTAIDVETKSQNDEIKNDELWEFTFAIEIFEVGKT